MALKSIQMKLIFSLGALSIGLYIFYVRGFSNCNAFYAKQTIEQKKIKIGEQNENTLRNHVTEQKKHAFFDLGSNNGDSVMYFFKDDQKIEEQKENTLRNYGTKSGYVWDVYIIEANPFFNRSLQKIRDSLQLLGHTVFLYTQTAAWIRNEKLQFYLDTVNPDMNYWGSSLLKDVPDVKKSNFANVQVNGIDVSQLLKQYSKNDEIVMKIDIEGSEYQLIEHLIDQKTLQLIDLIAVEFHSHFVKFPIDKIMKAYAQLVEKFNITVTPWG
jgi:FkbM family methyltransferase